MNPLIDSWHHIYPLIVGSGVALAFAELLVKQSRPESIPPIALKVNEWGRTVVPLMAMAAILAAIQYAVTQQNWTYFSISSFLLWLAYLVLVVVFIVPFVFRIPPLWRKFFYSQFEAAQSKDLKEVEDALRRTQDARQSTTE